MSRDTYIDAILDAGTRPAPDGVHVSVWRLACDLRACGLTVAGHRDRIVVSHGLRSADVEPLARRWTIGGRRVAWTQSLDDIDMAVEIAMVLVEQVEPRWWVGDPKGTPDVVWGATHPLDRKGAA